MDAEAEKEFQHKERAQLHPDPAIEFDDVRIRNRFEQRHADREAIEAFMTVLSVAHTVVPEGDTSNPAKIKYQAHIVNSHLGTRFV